jgi:hypothetical protein
VEDERVRQRDRRVDVERDECDDHRAFEDAERARRRRDDHRQPHRHDHETAGFEAEAQVEGRHQRPSRQR